MHINDLLAIASENKASDLHIKVGSHPVIRVSGNLIPLFDQNLNDVDIGEVSNVRHADFLLICHRLFWRPRSIRIPDPVCPR